MHWVIPALIAVTVVHIMAIVFGRTNGSVPQRIAFVSGIAGLLSIPAVIVAGLLSFCVAGGCRSGFSTADLFAFAFVAIALLSFGSLIALGTRGRRA